MFKIKRFTELEQIKNKDFSLYMKHRWFRLLGIFWKEYIEWYREEITGDIIFRYK